MKLSFTLVLMYLPIAMVSAIPFVAWVNSSTFHAQHICSESLGKCRTVAHAVFALGPENGDGALDRTTLTGVYIHGHDGQPHLTEGSYTMYEHHVISGVCQGTSFDNTTHGKNCTSFPARARVYDWGYESWSAYTPGALPDLVRVQIFAEGAEQPTSVAEIPYEVHLVAENNAPKLTISYNDFSSCSFQAGDEVIAHVVYSVAPLGSPLTNLTTKGKFSVDNQSWEDGLAIFEDHIDDKSGTFFQSFQFDVRWRGQGENICFNLQVVEGEISTAQYENCLKICRTTVQFHFPEGYCPDRAAVMV